MSIMAEVINSDCFDTDSESEYEDDSGDDLEITETTQDKNKEKLDVTEDNDSLSNNINNNNKFSKNKVYPAECIASSIEEIKSNISQVENSSIHNTIVTQEQVNKHLSRQSMSLPKPLENKPNEVPQLTVSLVSEDEGNSSTPTLEERKLLNYDSTSKLRTNEEEKTKEKKDKKSKKSKKSKHSDDTSMCQCIIL